MQTPKREKIQEFLARDEATCKQCGKPATGTKLVHLSVHASEFEQCGGPGKVWNVTIPWCPDCEQEPEERGCIHMPYVAINGPVHLWNDLRHGETPGLTRLLQGLSRVDGELIEWAYEICRGGDVAIMLHGLMQAIASQHQDWTYFQVLREARRHMPSVIPV